ncbi:mandelate racemase/muconate lactonizing enzyme family protein [Kribbella sp. NPDC050820]|uniref:mandelate racemase/muconate lactonizing enzyme family protein n=1 Tax=Kribbella sp. NPDC050820 TaxID=3155408 RepID=UPI0033C581B4
MKITAIETLRTDIQPNLVLLRLHTDEGLVGLGDAFYAPAPVESYLHETIAEVLLGVSDPTPEWTARVLTPYVGYQGGGVETRAKGAVDLAIWDLTGKRAGLPVVDLLGGAVRDRIPVYNTCAGPGYVSTTSRQESANWGIAADGRFEDLDAFLHRPAELAEELLADGINAMKIWPFDLAAEATGGTDISQQSLDEAIAVVAAIRDAVGLQIRIMIELHGLWYRPAAEKICAALTPYQPFWVEDPIRADGADALARLAAAVDVPIAVGETAGGRRGFLPLLQSGALDVVTVDPQWAGGLTEARKVASLADTFGVPIAPHDCTGPVSFAACVHLVASQPNGLVQETVRAFLNTWYGALVEGLPQITDGHIAPTRAPGLGIDLVPDLADRPGVTRRETTL